LPKSTTGITDEQCQGKQEAWTEGRRELTTMHVAKLFSSGQSWLSDLSGRAPITMNSYRGGRLCAGGRLTQATASVWWCTKEAAKKSWRRDVHLQVSSLVLRLMNRMTIPAHGTLSTRRVVVGHGRWTTPQIFLGWSKNIQNN
jgi:hypothetical protein